MKNFDGLLKARLQDKLPYHLENYTPSLRLQAYRKGKKCIDAQYGEDYRYYDLASLTKPLFTLSAFIKMTEQSPFLLDLTVADTLGWPHYEGVRIRHLLSHASGLAWWRPFYQKKMKGPWQKRRELLAKYLQMEKPSPQKTVLYSDLDYMVLGFVLENLLQQNLLICWETLKQYYINSELHFLIKPPLKKSLYAPTFSHQNHKKWVQGLVNDANAQSLGGISSHAGLFGRIEDVSGWLLQLRNSKMNVGDFLSATVLNQFMQRVFRKQQGDWTLGFMLPSSVSSSGRYFSKSSVGHLGFTGTSFWWDPIKDIFVVILANRYIGQKEGDEFKNVRPLIHDAVMETLLYE